MPSAAHSEAGCRIDFGRYRGAEREVDGRRVAVLRLGDAVLVRRERVEDDSGERAVGCLTTESGDFVAYGYVTSNCEPQIVPWQDAMQELGMQESIHV